MGFPKLLIEGRTRSIKELHMNVQKELICVNQKLLIAITGITNTCRHLHILAASMAGQFKNRQFKNRLLSESDGKKPVKLPEHMDTKGI